MNHIGPSSLFLRSIVVGVSVGIAASGMSFGFLSHESASASVPSEAVLRASDLDMDYGSAPMPDLEVTVSQTKDLTKQGVRVSWTGGEYPSVPPQGGVGGTNFLQIFQCWGDDPEHPGHPDRKTCQYGGNGGAAATRDGYVLLENVLPQDQEFTVPGTNFFTPTYTSIPFESVTGETVSNITTTGGSKAIDTTVDVNSNRFFTRLTTNEVSWVGSSPDGTGTVNFEIQTQMESPGLGCGTPKTEGNTVTGSQSCWLVILPRGVADNGESSVSKSGLFWDSWQHHLAVKMTFRPVGVRCQIGGLERQLSGSALVSQAVSSWQPQLCLEPSGSAFVVASGSEADALKSASTTGSGPLALTSQPMADTASDVNVYAPVAVSGLAIAFNISRRVDPFADVPDDYVQREKTNFASLNLTPRLVAKLLTSSYRSALPPGAKLSHIGYISPEEPGKNPTNITRDPDFKAVNDEEWQYQDLSSPALADALIPQGRSDLATQLWRYVLSDSSAVAFLNGEPDPWGMVVNPWYSTDSDVNPSGVGLALPRDNFPKADPIEKLSTASNGSGEGAINLVTWRPYVTDFDTAAYYVLRGDGQRLGGWTHNPPKWGKDARDLVGSTKVIGLTTTAASGVFQTVNASLLNPAGNFVGPTRDSLAAAVSAMTPTKNSAVAEFNFSSESAKAASGAYPLTMPVYAAINPLKEDSNLRASYASFIRYAVQKGQNPGTGIGSLPEGYAPLPASWVSQAMAAASAIQAGIRPSQPQNFGALTPYNYSPPVGNGPANVLPSVSPTGDTAGALSTEATPNDPAIGPVASVIPIGMTAGALAALGVPIYSRWRQRDV